MADPERKESLPINFREVATIAGEDFRYLVDLRRREAMITLA